MDHVEQQTKNKLKEWTLNPVRFVEEAFDLDGTPGKRISEQQREGLECYRRIITAKLKAAAKVPMSSQEQEDARRIGICVHSGHGPATTIGEERTGNPFLTSPG